MSVLSNMATALSRLTRWSADLVVPPVCLYCRKPLSTHDSLCGPCWRKIKFIRPPICEKLGVPLPFDIGTPSLSARAAANPPDYDRARSVAHFEGAMRDLIHQFKYADTHIARRLFGRWLKEAGAALLADADLIVPVPLDRWRLLRRRYNQAAILAREISAASGVPWDPLVLRRVKRTQSQVGLTSDQRRRNVQGAFAVAPGRGGAVDGRAVVLVDDVITTGSTVEACARALKRAGARQVDVLALALVTSESLINP